MIYQLLSFYARRFPFPHRGLKYLLKTVGYFGIANRKYLKKLPDDFYMYLNLEDHIQQQLFWYGNYEKHIADLIKKVIRPGGVFLDIGANIGYFSLLAAINEPKARIFALEPSRRSFEALKENITLNQLKNIEACNFAAGDSDEVADLFIAGPDNSGMTSFRIPENYSGESEKAEVKKIDNWLINSGLSKIDLVKLDIEGSELSALKGMSQAIQKFKPLIIIEINPDMLALFEMTTSDILNFIRINNYEIYLIRETGELTPGIPDPLPDTINALCVHPGKIDNYKKLFN